MARKPKETRETVIENGLFLTKIMHDGIVVKVSAKVAEEKPKRRKRSTKKDEEKSES